MAGNARGSQQNRKQGKERKWSQYGKIRACHQEIFLQAGPTPKGTAASWRTKFKH